MTESVTQTFEELRLPDGRAIACTNPGEAAFLWQEIIGDSPYSASVDGLRAGDVVVDVGAHVGLASLHFTDRVPGLRIVAFEAAPRTFVALSRNLGTFLPDAVAHQTAVGARADTVEFTYHPTSSSTSTLYPDEADETRNLDVYLTNAGLTDAMRQAFRSQPEQVETVRVDVRSLPALFEQHHVTEVALLKIDVERAELDVLDGLGSHWWPRLRRLLIEVHDIDGRLGVVVGRLATLGYRVQVSQAALFSGASVYDVLATRG